MHSQRGVTLVIGLIMLVLLTLLGMSAFNTSTSYFKVIGNMQHQTVAGAAAQSALDQVLSHGAYFTEPTTAPTSIDVDINGDGNANDLTVTLTQPCLLSTVTITTSELSPTNTDDLKCLGTAVGKNTGIMGQSLGGSASECARVTWRVTATVTDDLTRATAQVTEGASVRMDRTLADAYKNDATRRCSS
ncbi:MAG: hypothetical protein A2045_07325 [Rhodocyclales bacterium GWA2_65_20]|nr:MAG: hypothetical protein A2045_07325 [Rhodocyclales bacterium GWA2_65_20]